AVSVLTLALGIGATTAIYSVFDTILLQPLPFPDSGGLARVVEHFTAGGGQPGRIFQRGVPYADFLEWRTPSRTLADMVAVSELPRIAQTRDGTARLWGGMVSANTFTLPGVHAALGRTLVEGDAQRPDVAVLDSDTWRRVFHADPAVAGTRIELRSDWNGSYTPERERRLLTIVGVLPAGFEFPTGPLEFYTPIVVADPRRSANVTIMG